MQEVVQVLPSFEEVGHEMLPLPNFDGYLVHPFLGKIWSKNREKWLLVNAKGVGDSGYLLTSLKRNDGLSTFIYEHEAVYSAVWGAGKESWRSYGIKLEIDHIDRDVKNNSIDNLRLVDRASQYTPDVVADIKEQVRLSLDIARQIRQEYKDWTNGKINFYRTQAKIYGNNPRAIQNIILGVTFKEKV